MGGGSVHMHGGIVSVRADNMSVNQDVYGINSKGPGGPSLIHTPGTAFTLIPGGSGNASRIQQGNTIVESQSPFQWPPRDDPPVISSVSGADNFI